MNAKHNGNWLLHVPNNIIGKLFMWYFKKHVNTHAYRIKYRGRGARASVARRVGVWERKYYSDLPLYHAERVAIYVEFKTLKERRPKMKKAIYATQQEFASSSMQTPQYLAWHKLFKREFKKYLHKLGCSDVRISRPNHFDMSGFFVAPNTQIWYFRIEDLRWSKDKMLLRTAKSFDDYHGGTNCFVPMNVYEFGNVFCKTVGV